MRGTNSSLDRVRNINTSKDTGFIQASPQSSTGTTYLNQQQQRQNLSQHLTGGNGVRENSGENRNQRSRILGYMESSSPINVQRPLTGLGVMSDRVLTQRNTNTAATTSVHEDYDIEDNC